MKVAKLLFALFIFCSALNVKAQDVSLEARFDSLNLKGQFDYVYEKSESYEKYKVIKKSTINLLKKSSLDSINGYKTELSTTYKQIAELKNTVATKDDNITKLTDELEATNNTKNSMAFLGMEIKKGVYNSVMWGLVFGLLILASIMFLMFKRSHSITTETKKRLAEVEEEYETHRKSALKREQKLARQLMDEKLKHKF